MWSEGKLLVERHSEISDNRGEGKMRKISSNGGQVQLRQLLPSAKPDKFSLGRVESQAVCGHPGFQRTQSLVHYPDGRDGTRSKAMCVGLNVIGIQLTQHSRGSKECANLRGVNDI